MQKHVHYKEKKNIKKIQIFKNAETLKNEVFEFLNFPMCDPGGGGVSQKSKFLSFVFKNLRFLSPMPKPLF